MTLVIKKFGGTSLGDLSKIAEAADVVLEASHQSQPMIVVTSAMGGVTDTLVSMLPPTSHTNAESDVVLTSGEQVTAALMALFLQKAGRKSRSFLGWQLPIQTDTRHGDARITHINLDPLKALLREGGIGVVAGFQGVTQQKRLTTLGRGGSDVTALALAAWFKKEGLEADPVCHIHTDVDGVYTADPRYIPDAKHLKELSYPVMQTLANHGAQILHPSAVRYGQSENVPIYVRARCGTNPGTWIRGTRTSSEAPLLIAKQEGWIRLSFKPESHKNFITHLCKDHPDTCVLNEEGRGLFITHNLYQQNKSMLASCIEEDLERYCVISLLSKDDIVIDSQSLHDLTTDPLCHIRRHDNLWQIFTPTLTSVKVIQYFHSKFYVPRGDAQPVVPSSQ